MPERLERLAEAQSPGLATVHTPDRQVTSLQHVVNVSQSERDALAKELQQADAGPTNRTPVPWSRRCRFKASRCTTGFSWSHLMMPKHVPNDDEIRLQDRQADQHEVVLHGDLKRVEGVNHVMEITTVHLSSVASVVS